MNERLKRTKYFDGTPFDLAFLREIGIEIGTDWDGTLEINFPADIPERMISLILEFKEGIQKKLNSETRIANSCFVGGPLNGESYLSYSQIYGDDIPYCYHIKRGEWAVYKKRFKDDYRMWFMGFSTSKEKGRKLILK